MTLKPHPLTILYLMRSYWLVFIAPPIRVAVEHIIDKNTRILLPSEIVALIVVILLAIYRWSFTKINVYDDVLVLKKGFLIKTYNIITLSRASGVYIERGFMDVVFKSANIFINLEIKEPQKSRLKIKLKTCDAKRIFNYETKKTIRPVKSRQNFCRFFIVPIWIALIILANMLIALKKVNPIPFVILLAINMYYAVICRHNYINGLLCAEEKTSIIGSKLFSICELHCDKDKIGVIKVSQTPADRIFKTCKIKLLEYGAATKGIKVSNVDIKDAVKKVNGVFDLNINVNV